MLSRDAQDFFDNLQGFRTDDPSRPYCYRADETGEWYWLTEADLELYVVMANENVRDYAWGEPSVYTEWCQDSGQLMDRADAVRLGLMDADDNSAE